MHRLSSNFTLFLKIILPTIWIVFFGLLLLTLFIMDADDAPFLAGMTFKLIYAACYFFFIALLYLSVIPLKRIDSDGEFFFVSNYFKTFRYKFEDIISIKESNYILFKTLKFELKSAGSFGKKINIVADEFRVNEFIKAFPDKLKDML